ncbi:MAG: AIR carboxylase family protein [Candidatus Eisenbacteria bacterium]|jgi:phosphoribosylaminoimidazole-succinocarboxamide synthase|nr:AIR carboxylase family protein [Candidatus Eisenbacteria bacterium]
MTLDDFRTPQLLRLHSGKVRESFRVDRDTRLIITTDRVSAFDRVLDTSIPEKGAVLNGLSAFWFSRTTDIVANHFLRVVDPQASLVREVSPIRVEMIVRGYLTGSMWRQYAQGKRNFSGVTVADGLSRHGRFPEPIVTPTTKEESDREITPYEIVASGLVTDAIYEQMTDAARRLFEFGRASLAEKGILLVDTKYEFGIRDGTLMLIDELHTPDSSRFWRADSYDRDSTRPESLDKEFIRAFLLETRATEVTPSALPADVVSEARRRYRTIYEVTTGATLDVPSIPPAQRLCLNLARDGLIHDGFVAVIMGSPKDADHCGRIVSALEPYEVFVETRVVSAHKNPEDVTTVLRDYSDAAEPGAIIAVAGMSNGLGGALAANTPLPVINCPPFKDQTDFLANINSSLLMPSGVAAATVVNPRSAALAAVRSLNLPRLKRILAAEIDASRSELRAADRATRRDTHDV